MIEPPDIQEAAILSKIREAYGLHFEVASFLPVGADVNSAAFRLAAPGRQSCFLKLRKGPFEAASTTIPLFLYKQGIHAVIAPLETISGKPWSEMGEYTLLLYPFVDAANGYERPLSDQHRLSLGGSLNRIHSTRLPPEITNALPRESFGPRWRDSLVSFQNMLEHQEPSESVAKCLAATMRSNRSEVDQIIRRAGELALVLQSRPPDFVLCHADLHAGNILIDDSEQLYIVDWDNPILAPRERDLMFIGSGIDRLWLDPAQEEMFYQGYGARDVDLDCLAYYRYERIVEDLVAYCEQLLLSNEGGPDREQGLEYLQSNFLPGGTIEMARKVDRSLS